MTTIDQTRTRPARHRPTGSRQIDMDTLMEFVGRFVGDLGATIAAGNVLLGDRLGLYRALADGPADARALAAATGTDPRYVDGVAARPGGRRLRRVRRRRPRRTR